MSFFLKSFIVTKNCVGVATILAATTPGPATVAGLMAAKKNLNFDHLPLEVKSMIASEFSDTQTKRNLLALSRRGHSRYEDADSYIEESNEDRFLKTVIRDFEQNKDNLCKLATNTVEYMVQMVELIVLNKDYGARLSNIVELPQEWYKPLKIFYKILWHYMKEFLNNKKVSNTIQGIETQFSDQNHIKDVILARIANIHAKFVNQGRPGQQTFELPIQPLAIGTSLSYSKVNQYSIGGSEPGEVLCEFALPDGRGKVELILIRRLNQYQKEEMEIVITIEVVVEDKTNLKRFGKKKRHTVRLVAKEDQKKN